MPVTASSTRVRRASSKNAISPLEPRAKIPSTPPSSRRAISRSSEGRSTSPSAVSGVSRGGTTPVSGAGAADAVVMGSILLRAGGPGRSQQAGGGGEQAAGVLVAGTLEDLGHGALFDDPPAVHHHDR